MWTYARIYNTLQIRTPYKPGLAPLPDRLSEEKRPPKAVDSITLAELVQSGQGPTPVSGQLAGQRIDSVENELYPFIDAQLPPMGDPDLEELDLRSVVSDRINRSDKWPWGIRDFPEGRLYLGEKYHLGTTDPVDFSFGFPTVGEGVGVDRKDSVFVSGEKKKLNAPRLLFNPKDGRLAYPFLLPHAGRRPPFAPKNKLIAPQNTMEPYQLAEDPKHQGTAYLGPRFAKTDPGRVGPDNEPRGVPFGSGLVPEEAELDSTHVKHYDIVAIELPIDYSTHNGARVLGTFGERPDTPDLPEGPRNIEIIGGVDFRAWEIRIDDVPQNITEIPIQAGDTLSWRVEVPPPGHGVVFLSRPITEAILDFLPGGQSLVDKPGFGVEAFGTDNFDAGTTLARAVVKANIPAADKKPIDFTCVVHGPGNMNAKLVLESKPTRTIDVIGTGNFTAWEIRIDNVIQNITEIAIQPGDTLTWRVESLVHGVVYVDREITEAIMDFLPGGQPLTDKPNFGSFGERAFGTDAFGAGTTLARAVMKANIPGKDRKPIDFTCFVHGPNNMNARLVFTSKPTPPLSADVDPRGQIFVLREDAADVFAGRKPAEPLVIRANAGDVVDITLTSALVDTGENDFYSKVGIHTHLVQYDVQSSDGAVAGLNYETSIRPSLKWDRVQEKFVSIDEAQAHSEQVHYRWWCDVELGTIYWHDHSLLKDSLPHGLFAATIVEPPDATYHDPQTGDELYVRNSENVIDRTSGTNGLAVVDIRINGNNSNEPSFREFVPLLNDGNQNRKSINLRYEKRKERTSRFDLFWDSDGRPDWSKVTQRENAFFTGKEMLFSSILYGDPVTPIWRTYERDAIRIRIEGGGTDEIHTLNMHGHRWRYEHNNPNSTLRDFILVGVSEAFSLVPDPTLIVPAGDYLYASPGIKDLLDSGKWGLLRIRSEDDTDEEGALAKGRVRVYIDRPATVTVPKGHIFTSSSGVPFLTAKITRADSTLMRENNISRRFDPPAFFFDVDLVAEKVGDEANMPSKMRFATKPESIEFLTPNGEQPKILEITSRTEFRQGRTPLYKLPRN